MPAPKAQSLFDMLAGAAGAPVNRPALDAYVAQGQAMAGLRTARTEEALIRAQQAVEQMKARDDLEQTLGQMLAPSEAAAATRIMQAGFGDAKVALEALLSGRELINRNILSDPTQLGTAAQTAAQQGIKGEVATPIEVKPEFATLPGAFQPNVQQTPGGAAATAKDVAQGNLYQAEASNPALFHPRGGIVAMLPEQQTKLQQLMQAGVIGPSQLYSFSRNPSLVDAAYGAFQNDPTAIAGLAEAKRNLMTNLTSGQMGRNLTSLNTAVAHMSLVPQTIQALNNGDVTLLNRLFNGLNAQMGSPPPVLANQLAQFLGREVVNAIQANGGGVNEREEAQAIFDRAQSPETLVAAAQQAAELLAGRAHAIEQDYVGTMSLGQPGTEETYRRQFRTRWLTPETQKALGMAHGGLGGGGEPAQHGAAPPATAGAAPAPAQPAQPAPGAIAEGSVAVNPTTGQRIILRGGQWQPL